MRVDLRARASRSHQVLKRSLTHGSRFGPSQEGEEDFQEDLCHVCKCQDLFLDKM